MYPTYQRHMRDFQQASFLPKSISGRSVEMKDASSEKDRRRIREQYAGMRAEDKEILLRRSVSADSNHCMHVRRSTISPPGTGEAQRVTQGSVARGQIMQQALTFMALPST